MVVDIGLDYGWLGTWTGSYGFNAGNSGAYSIKFMWLAERPLQQKWWVDVKYYIVRYNQSTPTNTPLSPSNPGDLSLILPALPVLCFVALFIFGAIVIHRRSVTRASRRSEATPKLHVTIFRKSCSARIS
jgi:hypothetical protein